MLHRPPRTILCCLLPRSGIISICFFFGCWAFLDLLSLALTEVFEVDLDPPPIELSRLIILGINSICGLAYFYSSYLAYKRQWWSLYYHGSKFMILSTLVGLYSGLSDLLGALQFAKEKFSEKTEDNVDSQFFYMPFLFLGMSYLVYFTVVIIEILFIQQTRSYVSYVISKKDEKPII